MGYLMKTLWDFVVKEEVMEKEKYTRERGNPRRNSKEKIFPPISLVVF